MTAAPDSIEPFVAWRAWGIDDEDGEILLRSFDGTVWPGGKPLLAYCRKKQHAAPHAGCSCGIYGLLDALPFYDYDGERESRYAVFGSVLMYGKVVVGTTGYRAEKAYPSALWVAHKDYRLVKPLREAYGVPVKMADPYKFPIPMTRR